MQVMNMLYQGDQMLSSAFPLQWTIFFSAVAWLCMMVAWIDQFLLARFDISHNLCAIVAYCHIIPFENFVKLVWSWKMQIYELKKLLSRGCNGWPTIMWVKPYVVTVALSFYMTCAHLLHWQNYITITTTC